MLSSSVMDEYIFWKRDHLLADIIDEIHGSQNKAIYFSPTVRMAYRWIVCIV